MKTLSRVLISTLIGFLALLNFSMPNSAKAFAPPDQANVNGLTGYWRILDHQWVGQSFKPSKNRLDAIGIKAAGGGASASVVAWVVDLTNSQLIASRTITVPSAASWVYFDFPTDIVITHPGGEHMLWLSTTSANAYWAVGHTNTYANGVGYVDNIPAASDDYGFITYGYDFVPEEPAPSGGEEIADEGGPLTESTNPPAGDAVAAPASDDIVAPSDLNAADVAKDNGTSIKLDWGKSTTEDIDGYKIYRSTSKTKNFVNIGKTDPEILKYTDKTVKAGKTYYYFVRAYKDKLESANSNVAKIVPVNNTPKEELSFWQKLFGPYLWYTIGGLIIILAGLGVLIYFLVRKKKPVQVQKPI